MLMSKLHGVTDVLEQSKSIFNRQLLLIAILVKRQPIDELHHNVGLAIRSHVRLKLANDVRMPQIRKSLHFSQYSLHHRGFGQVPRMKKFDRNFFLIGFTASCAIDRTEAAAGDSRLNGEIANLRSDPTIRHVFRSEVV